MRTALIGIGRWLAALVMAVFCSPWPAAQAEDGGDRLTYLTESDPYYVSQNFARLTTPQWVGEEGVEAVVVLGIDDMRGPEKWEVYLRPILERLKQIDGRAPVSIMTCTIEPSDPHLQQWLKEGLSLDVHTVDHPCPLLSGGDFAKAKSTYDRCVDLLASVPGNRPVAFRTPCCDSLNTVSPRFFSEIFNSTTSAGRYLSIDTSVFNVLTSADPELPRESILDADGTEKFTKYLPADRTFVNTIYNYPYPYVIGARCWEFPCVTPSDWSAQHLQQPFNPRTVADLQAALDAVVAKQGVYNLVFHPHGWIRNDQVIELIDHAVAKHGSKVKFLTFREAQERLDKHLLAERPLRAANGQDNGVRLLDVNADGFMDVVIGNEKLRQTRIWSPENKSFSDSEFPLSLVHEDAAGNRREAGVRFGVLQKNGFASMLVQNDEVSGGWHFDGAQWTADDSLVAGLKEGDSLLPTAMDGVDRGARLRDLDNDGRCEIIFSNPQVQKVFVRNPEANAWSLAAFALPEGTNLVNTAGRDAGLRFVDIDEDGYRDVIFSNETSYALHLFTSMTEGWSRLAAKGERGDADAIPMITREGANNGAWFHSRHMFVQNEDTDKLKDLVDRRSFEDLQGEVQPGPKSAEASLRSIRVRPGFKVELVAAEPLVMDPVAFNWGADGRLWVVEMADYPLGIDGKGKPGGRVRYLQDDDGDGKYDQSVLFLDGLNYPNGIAPWGKGVLITAAPDILYAEDTDGDGRADVKEILYTGFAEGNQQHRVNGLTMGLDNWLYCANGDSGGSVKSLLTGTEMDIRGRDLRIRPADGSLDPQTGQSQYGRNRDDWGNWFGNNNSNPMFHFVLADHYIRRNPHVAAPELRRNVPVAGGPFEIFPISRTLERFNDPGAVNRVTSANSTIVYRDDLFGPAFENNSFCSEPVHNLIHREVMSPDGVTFTSRRADEEQQSEFLASSDNWFRPTMLQTGPDGALWVADMYRHVIEHPQWIPQEWQERLDLRAGHDKGRIYRIYPVDKQPRDIPKLDRLKIKELVAALDSPNGWQRDTVQRLLLEKNDPAAAPLLKALATKSPRALARLHALCTLDGLGALDAAVLKRGLSDEHPGVRRHAVRLSESHLKRTPELGTLVAALAEDADAHVRLQVAYSLGAWNSVEAGQALARLAIRDREDPFITAAVLSSANQDNVSEMLAMLFAGEEGAAPPEQLLNSLLATASGLGDNAALVKALAVIAKTDDGEYLPWQYQVLAGLLDALDRQGSPLAKLQEQGDARFKPIIEQLAQVFEIARRHVEDPESPEEQRLLAIPLLARGPDRHQEDIELLSGLLVPQSSGAIQAAAVRSLGALGHEEIPALLLAGWKGYGPQLRSHVLDVLASREAWMQELLAAINAGPILPAEIDAARRRQLVEHPNAEIAERAQKLLAESFSPDRRKVIENYQTVFSLEGDRERGAAAFKKSCSVCHRLDDVGHVIGPDLAALTDKSPNSMLTAILDPNRAVEAKFVNYVALTDDGLTFSGMLASETGNSVTLVAQEGKQQVLLRGEIETLESTGKSLMPEGMEKDLPEQALADIIAYVSSHGPPRKQFEGNNPSIITPDEDGSLQLTAANAEIYGSTLVFEPQYQNLGFWQSNDDRAQWLIEAPVAGKYQVELEWACDPGTAGNTLAIQAGGAKLALKVAGTDSWDDYRRAGIGVIELKAGRQAVVLRPEGSLQGPLMDLRRLTLTPVSE